MDIGGPEFVLAIIGMAMFTGVIRTWIRSKHGLPDREPRNRAKSRGDDAEVQEMLRLRSENRQLTDRLETSEERLAVLERIVTDRSYSLASEIEALREIPQRESAGERSAARSGSREKA